MACLAKGGWARIYPANGPHRGQYTFHCAALSLSILPLSLSFLSVFLFFTAFPSFIFRARVCQVPSSRFHNFPWQITTMGTKTSVFDACFLFLSRQRWLEAYKNDCLTKKALWINVSCISFDHLFRFVRSFVFFREGREREDGCKVMDTCEWKYLQEYDFFVWGFVLEKINLKNFLNINETG